MNPNGKCMLLMTLMTLFLILQITFKPWRFGTHLQYNANQVPQTNPRTDAMVVIQTFPFLFANRSEEYLQPYPSRQLRMEEYIIALISTLENSYITQVNILYSSTALRMYVREQLTNLPEYYRNKLKFVEIKEPSLANTLLKYAYTNFQNEVVIIKQADCYPGYGLDLVDKSKMLQHNVMYALTRHGRVEKNCDMRKQGNSMTCDKSRYSGSHDTYIFIPRGNIPSAALKSTNLKTYSPGIDNVIVFTFRQHLKFNVLNSCKVIVFFHLHCVSSVRAKGVTRVNNRNNSGTSYPTDKLYI